MNTYNRLFGSGPVGLAISLVLLFIAIRLRHIYKVPDIFTDGKTVRVLIFCMFTLAAVIMLAAANKALGVKLRGKALITTGVFKYFRHPTYAAFLTFFDFGLVFLLNNWIFVFWALLLHPVWHFIVSGEEKSLKGVFPGDYEKYCENTGRFFPRLGIQRKTLKVC